MAKTGYLYSAMDSRLLQKGSPSAHINAVSLLQVSVSLSQSPLQSLFDLLSLYVAHREARYPTPAADLPPPLSGQRATASGELNARRPEHKNFLQFWYHRAFIDVCIGLKSSIAWKYGRARARHVLYHHSIIFNFHPID